MFGVWSVWCDECGVFGVMSVELFGVMCNS